MTASAHAPGPRAGLVLLVLLALAAAARHRALADVPAEPRVAASGGFRTNHVRMPALPPAPDGVTDFALHALFRSPVGPRGLEYSDAARALDGRVVRITGYMVRQTQPVPWGFLLSPVPQSLHEREYGLCDDLPGSTIHVFMPKGPQPMVPFRPGLHAVTGVLELGTREEADGRQSVARLRVDDRSPAAFQPVTNFVPVTRVEPVLPPAVPPVAATPRRAPARLSSINPKDTQKP